MKLINNNLVLSSVILSNIIIKDNIGKYEYGYIDPYNDSLLSLNRKLAIYFQLIIHFKLPKYKTYIFNNVSMNHKYAYKDLDILLEKVEGDFDYSNHDNYDLYTYKLNLQINLRNNYFKKICKKIFQNAYKSDHSTGIIIKNAIEEYDNTLPKADKSAREYWHFLYDNDKKIYFDDIMKKQIFSFEKNNYYDVSRIKYDDENYNIDFEYYIYEFLKEKYSYIKNYCLENYISKHTKYFVDIIWDYEKIYDRYEKALAIPNLIEVYKKLKNNGIDNKVIYKKLNSLFGVKDEIIDTIVYIQKTLDILNSIFCDYEIKYQNNSFDVNKMKYNDLINYIKEEKIFNEDEIMYLILLYLNKISFDDENDDFCEFMYEYIFGSLKNTREEIVQRKKEKYYDEVELKRKEEIDRILSGDLDNEKDKTIFYNRLKEINNGYDFEQFVSDLYFKLGYKSRTTKKSNDQGADVILEKENEKYVIQTKYYSGKVGNNAVQEIVAAKGFYNASKAIVVTNSSYTVSAVKLAEKNNVELIDQKKLLEMIENL